MARFDVFKYANDQAPLLLDVQANLLSDLNTRVVIPLIPQDTLPSEILPRLKPVIQVEGKSFILMTTDIGTVELASLGELVSNIETDYSQDIIEALDFLFQGF